MSADLENLSEILKKRNVLDDEISRIIGYPAEKGHIGEFIASRIFNITLNKSATQAGHDGIFSEGHLRGKTVNVKYYGKRESILDMKSEFPIDYYLVLTGPKTAPASSRGTTRPFIIKSVFLFNTQRLHEELKGNVKLGIATSVRQRLWKEAELYPNQTSKLLILNETQRSNLELFA